MNRRVLYFVLAVQIIFAGSLIFIGLRARENRRNEYLDATHRVTSGIANAADFAQLSARLNSGADAQTVRGLFGPPLQTAAELTLAGEKPLQKKGNFWLYYAHEPPAPPVSPASVAQLAGPVRCFVVEFDEKGRARAEMLNVIHPVWSAR